jgi:PiT family inorganic phosphate transporter
VGEGHPSSSSHALVGGLVGAGVAHAGMEGIIWTGLNKTVIAIFLSPTIGMFISMLIMLASSWMVKGATARRAEGGFKSLHLISSAAIRSATVLMTRRRRWGSSRYCFIQQAILAVNFMCRTGSRSVAISRLALARCLVGGRLSRQWARGLQSFRTARGFGASFGGSIMVFAASWLGIPVSTTHTITGCVIGVGAAKRESAVRWGIAGNLLVAWILTVPASALVGAAFYMLTRLF